METAEHITERSQKRAHAVSSGGAIARCTRTRARASASPCLGKFSPTAPPRARRCIPTGRKGLSPADSKKNAMGKMTFSLREPLEVTF